MTWPIFAFACAILLSATSILEKKVLQKLHTTDFSVSVAILNFIFSIPFLFFIDFSKVSRLVLALIFVTALLAAIAFFLVNKGLRHMEISTVSPLLALNPGVTALFAFFVLNEGLKSSNVVGIILMIIGSYILSSHNLKNIFEPMHFFTKSKYVHLVLLSLFFYSMGAVFDRAILHVFAVSVPIYLVFFHLFIALLFIPFEGIFGIGVKGIIQGFRMGGKNLVLASIFTVGYRFFQMQAVTLAPVGLVSAIKRSSSFFTTLVGGELFHEHNLARKLIASAIIIAGSFMILF